MWFNHEQKINPQFNLFCHLLHHYCDIISLATGVQCPASVGCFCCRNGSPQLTLALCQTEWSHSRFVPQCAGDENGCPLRNSRNFHLALPASVGGCMGPKVAAYMRWFHCTICAEYLLLVLGWFKM